MQVQQAAVANTMVSSGAGITFRVVPRWAGEQLWALQGQTTGYGQPHEEVCVVEAVPCS